MVAMAVICLRMKSRRITERWAEPSGWAAGRQGGWAANPARVGSVAQVALWHRTRASYGPAWLATSPNASLTENGGAVLPKPPFADVVATVAEAAHLHDFTYNYSRRRARRARTTCWLPALPAHLTENGGAVLPKPPFARSSPPALVRFQPVVADADFDLDGTV
ncbi:MAG: hypothetical protein ACI81V_001017 [Lentimonas sp.]